ncbi:MAG: ABC transporter ATP-binding protein [Actinomycetota bacterium]
MDTLRIDITVPRRHFDVQVALEVGATATAIAGPSGAGKTTLLRTVCGLEEPTRGLVALGSQVWFDAATNTSVPTEARRVGMVFQDYALFPHMTVRQNVAFGARGGIDDVLERFRLTRVADQRPEGISGGEAQRVAIARALARRPAVVLLDEPMASLDPMLRGEVGRELSEVLADLAVPTLLVTHDFAEAAALCDTVGVLVEGRLLQLGPPEALISAPANDFVRAFTRRAASDGASGGDRGRSRGPSPGAGRVPVDPAQAPDDRRDP